MRRTVTSWLWLWMLIVPSALAGAVERPLAVSPGSSEGSMIADSCPTFSWTAVDGAIAHELTVYRILEGEVESEPVLEERIPGRALSWTPSILQCLKRGGRYAWSIRAITAGAGSEWSSANLFEVAGAPTEIELGEALALVRRYLASDFAALGAGGAVAGGTTEKEPSLALPAPPSAREGPTRGPESEGVAALTVEGEVRTVSPAGAPRVWGRGRPGTLRWSSLGGFCRNSSGGRFGLSEMAVPWHSAADACPAGTWVCEVSEVEGSCDTIRPNGFADGYDCSGTPQDWAGNEHRGWVVGVAVLTDAQKFGQVRVENNSTSASRTCYLLPVWCCSE